MNSFVFCMYFELLNYFFTYCIQYTRMCVVYMFMSAFGTVNLLLLLSFFIGLLSCEGWHGICSKKKVQVKEME